MARLISAIKLDLKLQVRNNLYTIGIIVAILMAVGFVWLGKPEQMITVIPALLLLITGGTSMMYVGAMILFEKDEGTLAATIVTPVRNWEYLTSKIFTLTLLSTLESVIFVGLAILIFRFQQVFPLPNLGLLTAGLTIIGLLYVLIGIILMVRYEKITDFLIPLAVVAMIFQVPFLHFWGVIRHPLFLLIPTSAPTILLQAAFIPIKTWEWVYAVGYSTVLLVGLIFWVFAAYRKHILGRVR